MLFLNHRASLVPSVGKKKDFSGTSINDWNMGELVSVPITVILDEEDVNSNLAPLMEIPIGRNIQLHAFGLEFMMFQITTA